MAEERNSARARYELVSNLMRYDPNGRTYRSLVTRARRKAASSLFAEGFTIRESNVIVEECFERAAQLIVSPPSGPKRRAR